jgi:hypothetical protein
MRVGQALGLRHCDFVSRRREVHIVPRADNANGARAKLRSAAVVPVSAPLVRLYSEYCTPSTATSTPTTCYLDVEITPIVPNPALSGLVMLSCWSSP